LEDRSDGRKAGYGLGENLPENGICVIHLSRTFKELLMKIVKATLIALAVAAASTAMAQSDPALNTVVIVDPTKWDVAGALAGKPFKANQNVYDQVSYSQVTKDIYRVNEIVAPAPAPKSAFMAVVKSKKVEEVLVDKSTAAFVEEQKQPSPVAPWAWVKN